MNGYLVEASGTELVHAAGYGNHEGSKIVGYHDRDGFSIGTTIDVTRGHIYMSQLRDRETDVRKSVGQLRALADMIEGGLPTTIIVPKS